ncbi:MAG: hypothetical protein JRF47_15595, partial [Deltaproteobacteria bacterium]|nr:hypothetical protein [Deltaproteobacteria bacterium]
MTKITKKSYLTGIAFAAVFLAAAGYYMTTSAAQALTENHRGTIIRGRVTSTYGPVDKAKVRVAGEETYTLTDREGRYELVVAHSVGTELRVTARKEGWFNNRQVTGRSGRIRDILLNPIYLDDRPEYRFISPVTCSRCHVKLTRYYDRSKMAHTTSN